MKKLLTLSLVALLACSASAVTVKKAQKVHNASIERSEKKITNYKVKTDAVVASKPEVENVGGRLLRRPLNTHPYNASQGAAFERPMNAFFSHYSSEGYSLVYKRMYAPPYSNLEFVNRSLLTGYYWAYMDPATEENATSRDTDLSFDVAGYNVISAPALTTKIVTDTVYNFAESLQIGGEVVDWGEGEGGFVGASNTNLIWTDGPWIVTWAYGIHSQRVDSVYTAEFKQYGIDTVKCIAYAEYMNKPTSPYLLTDVSIMMVVDEDQTLTLKVYKAEEDENGNPVLGDQISTDVTLEMEASDYIEFAVFSDIQGVDPETGMEGPLVIDEPVFVVMESTGENYPIVYFHEEELPNEKHAYQLINYEYQGTEYTDVDNVNYTYNDGTSVTSFCFNYNLAYHYLHNNESSDTFNVPAEGGSKTFNVSSDMFYEGNGETWWDITDPDLEYLPDWITVEIEDEFSEPDSTNTMYYQGYSNVKITVAPLPDGVVSRTQDVMLSFDGAKCIFHIVQPEGAAPAYNEFYMFGDFNGWVGGNNPLAMTATENAGIYEATTVIGKNGEFKFATPWDEAPEENLGYRWFGGVDEVPNGYFLVDAEQLNKPLTLVDNGGSNFRMEKPGKYIFRLNANNLTVEIIPVEVPGDVNGDGVCNAADVTALYNWILNNDDSALVNGNQNGDDVINAGDVTTVYNIILGN